MSSDQTSNVGHLVEMRWPTVFDSGSVYSPWVQIAQIVEIPTIRAEVQTQQRSSTVV